MRPVLFRLGPIPIWAYGASLAAAFFVGAWLAARRARARGLDGEHVWNACTWIFVAGLVAARMLHIVVERPELIARPWQWLSIWEGGLVFYGAFIAAIVATAVYVRVKKVDFWTLADAMAPMVALGHVFVRVGCFLNGCCYGKPAEWGVAFPSLHDGVRRQPTQLYEAAAGLALMAALLVWERRAQRVKGELIFLYAAAYGVVRFLIEFARADYRGGTLLGLTPSQWIGLVAFVAGALGLVALRRRAPPAPASSAS